MRKLDKNLLLQNIDSVADYDFKNNKISGSAYLVYQEGNLDFQKCYGLANTEKGLPVKNNSLFRLASMTKPITAFAVLILVDRGALSLSDDVAKYLPQFNDIRIKDLKGNDLGKPQKIPTVKNILSHCSGIGSRGDKLAGMTSEDKKTVDSYIDYLIKAGLDFEPESAQMYSGTGAFDVLVKIVETVASTDYLTFLKREIFEPLNMTDTTFIPDLQQKSRLVQMHTFSDGRNTVFKMPENCIFENFPESHYLGGAGLVSTLKDYSSFAKMLLNCGKIGNKVLVSEKTFNLMRTPTVPKEIMGGCENWGLGVRVIVKKEYPYLPVGTFGWSGAYGSHFWIDPENKIYAVFMKNSKVDGGGGNESARKFEEAVYKSFEK